ncbi:MAG: hypothetical protein LBT21_03270 [Oscillospiraceae bacterium]|jgi:hypothetical protein|nr:hypothetical protein [Oscillospiraceae bacterium]
MKKISASFVLRFLSVFLGFVLLILGRKGEQSYLFLFSIFGFIWFFVLLSGCKELGRQYPPFEQQRKNYWRLIGWGALALVAFMIVDAIIIFAFFRESPQKIQAFSPIPLMALFCVGYVFGVLLSWRLIQNIRLLGRGRPIGHRALRTAWVAQTVMGCVNILSGIPVMLRIMQSVELTNAMDSSSVFNIVRSAVNVAAVGLPAVCMIRTAHKIAQLPQTLEPAALEKTENIL